MMEQKKVKYKFIYACHKIHPKVNRTHEQWYLLIDNIDSFMRFMDFRSKGLVEKYWKLKGMNKTYVGHLSDKDMIIIEQLLYLYSGERETIVDDCKILDRLLSGYRHIFLEEGRFVVSPNNAFRHIDETFKILKTEERKNLIFPTASLKDIRIIKWPNGTHYYAKIGNQDVCIGGEQKWNTKEKAQIAAEEFLFNKT